MPLLIGVVVVLAFIAIVAVARRFIGVRSDEHAMETYEHALDVLGDASRRNDSQRVRIVSPDEVAKAHIRSPEGDTDLVPRQGAAADVPPPRIRLEPPVLPGVPPGEPLAPGTPARRTPAAPPLVTPARGIPAVPARGADPGVTGRPPADGTGGAVADQNASAGAGGGRWGARRSVADRRFAGDRMGAGAREADAEPVPAGDRMGAGAWAADAEPAPAGAGVPDEVAVAQTLTFDETGAGAAVAASPRRPRGLVDPVHERRVRRAATGGMAVVAAAAVAVAALQLAGGPSKPRAASGTTSPHGSSPQGSLGTTPGGNTTTTAPQHSSTTTTVPNTIIPETSSATEVAYRAPATTYSITFQATTGPCWVGVQATAGGAWLWMQTIRAGETQTYSASGSVIVRLGAPPKVRVSVDGITVQLPPSNVQPYDLTFTPDG